MSDANYNIEGMYDDSEENYFDQELMEELWWRRTEMTEMKAQIKQLTKERDEARREACENGSTTEIAARSLAKFKGWDCFKETT
jgi:hypothetical protein